MEQDVVAVFPLPNVVFFPQTELPLHIFEPRYCEMIGDTVENKQLIGIFLLQPGWQEDYYGSPPIYSVGCAGEMVHCENLPEGKFNILLSGIARVRALETVQEYPYRKVRVQILPEIVSRDESEVQVMKRELLRDFRVFSQYIECQEIERSWQFAKVVNMIATALPMDLDARRTLLEENDVYCRAVAVQEQLASHVSVLKLTGSFSHLRPTDPNRN